MPWKHVLRLHDAWEHAVQPRHAVELLVLLAPERENAGEHHIQQHSRRPDIADLALVPVVYEHLRRNVLRCPTQRFTKGLPQLVFRVPEVAELQLHLIRVWVPGQQRILQLDVTIGNAKMVEEVHCHQQLLEQAPCMCLRQALGALWGLSRGRSRAIAAVACIPGVYQVCHVATTDVLHHDAQVLVRQEELMELDNVLVALQQSVIQNLALCGTV
mmetsp:Transcript_1352/g.4038  ORF Transcript_1352/g.4038 Transcript_1352/m.4038 type:complete len:215 (+) Transcript_1352:1185-1829(+)